MPRFDEAEAGLVRKGGHGEWRRGAAWTKDEDEQVRQAQMCVTQLR